MMNRSGLPATSSNKVTLVTYDRRGCQEDGNYSVSAAEFAHDRSDELFRIAEQH